ncbi:guanylate kinase [Paraneptunicella aestuarii]|uniref:guanylate kinase n=1 Tax=Paraneptunicella aestuarii TaxID=2831148 RepID=UPI001E45AC58|nr:guanylate kinase [Paraneptunicella aestuarii]UAA38381.1 guanylate kinase [Paraneptunicella aestuarii]
MSKTPGNLFILAAPSGAGKSSLIKALIERYKEDTQHPVQVSVSHTTRKPRPGEVHGVHYHFVDESTFKKLIEEDVFFEWAEAFGNYYGTSKQTIADTLQHGIDVFLDIEWQGARQVKSQIPDARTIFIAPPSKKALHERLTNRQQDSAEEIARRMEKAESEISHYHEFDFIVINDDFDQALREIDAIVISQRLRKAKQVIRYKALFDDLLSGNKPQP